MGWLERFQWTDGGLTERDRCVLFRAFGSRSRVRLGWVGLGQVGVVGEGGGGKRQKGKGSGKDAAGELGFAGLAGCSYSCLGVVEGEDERVFDVEGENIRLHMGWTVDVRLDVAWCVGWDNWAMEIS